MFDGMDNVALGKPAIQVNTMSVWEAGLAVDGNANSQFDAGSCTATLHGPQPWWSVDLGDRYNIKGFSIINRGDAGNSISFILGKFVQTILFCLWLNKTYPEVFITNSAIAAS